MSSHFAPMSKRFNLIPSLLIYVFRIAIFLQVTGFLLLLQSCTGSGNSTGNVAGSGNNTGNVAGVFEDSTNSGVANIIVSLYKVNYNPVEPDSIPNEWTVRTNDKGEYLLEKVAAGSYNIEANDYNNNTVALVQGVSISQDQENAGDTVAAPQEYFTKSRGGYSFFERSRTGKYYLHLYSRH